MLYNEFGPQKLNILSSRFNPTSAQTSVAVSSAKACVFVLWVMQVTVQMAYPSRVTNVWLTYKKD
jgi:hypothetical protein